MSDAFSRNLNLTVVFADAVAVIDSGALQHHDYTAADYMLTPVDYVSAQRVF
jgi:hypothetical protein